MTVAWRISKVRHPPFDGSGARMAGARWNFPGVDVIYASDTYAGAILEILAHVSRPRTLPGPHHAVRIEIPDGMIETLDEELIPGWDAHGSEVARGWGDVWLAERRSVAASLPSLPARPVGRTVAINPRHPDITKLDVGEPLAVPWDERLF